MRAARNKRHIVSGGGHPSAEITSDGTCCHDRDPHVARSVGANDNLAQNLPRSKGLGAMFANPVPRTSVDSAAHRATAAAMRAADRRLGHWAVVENMPIVRAPL